MQVIMRVWCLLALLVACTAHSISGSPTLRLRGGAWGGGGKKEQPQQDISTDMLSNAAAAHTPAPAVTPESGPPQINLATHAFEYALAGGFDGIRSGVGQAVGSSFAQWVGGALQKGGSGAGMAFAGLFGKLPFFRGMRVREDRPFLLSCTPRNSDCP